MFKVRKEVKLVLILFTIVFSIYLGMRRSSLDKAFMQADVAIEESKADYLFDKSFNDIKIRFEYKVENLNEMNTLLSELKEKGNTLYSEIKNSYYLVVFEIPSEETDPLLAKLRSIKGISNENIQRAGPIIDNTDLKENLNNNQILKRKYQNLINNSLSPSSDRLLNYKRELDVVQATIDSLNIQEDVHKHNAEFDIVYLSAVKSISGTAAIRRSMSVFVLTTIISLILLVIGLIICFYIFVLLQKLMLAFGIKTVRSSSRANYNYYYNKKDRGRKTKRIYKDKDGNIIKKEETKEDKH